MMDTTEQDSRKAERDAAQIGLRFGAMSDPIASQLEAQGMALPTHESVLLQRFADAVSLLRVHGILTDAESRKARRRIHGRVLKSATRSNP